MSEKTSQAPEYTPNINVMPPQSAAMIGQEYQAQSKSLFFLLTRTNILTT